MRQNIIKIQGSTLFNGVILFLLYTVCFLDKLTFAIPKYANVKKYLLYILLVYVVFNLNTILKRKYVWFYVLLGLFSAFSLYSAVLNKHTVRGYGTITTTTLFLLSVWEIGTVLFTFAEKRMISFVQKTLLFYLVLLTLLNDFLLFIHAFPSSHGLAVSLVGTKFGICYLHMHLIVATAWGCFGFRKFTRQKMWMLLGGLFGYSALISLYVDCMTGIVGLVILFAYLLLVLNSNRERRQHAFFSPVSLLIVLAVCTLGVFSYVTVLKYPVVQNIIVNVLKTDLTLTGRTDIYARFVKAMHGHWMWGFGYGNSFPVSMKLFGYANAQNSMLDMVLQVGVPAAVAMTFLFLYIFKKTKKIPNRVEIVSVVAMIYVYIWLGIIEITYLLPFFYFVILLAAVFFETETQDERGLILKLKWR